MSCGIFKTILASKITIDPPTPSCAFKSDNHTRKKDPAINNIVFNTVTKSDE